MIKYKTPVERSAGVFFIGLGIREEERSWNIMIKDPNRRRDRLCPALL
jgi:hypothetical protein